MKILWKDFFFLTTLLSFVIIFFIFEKEKIDFDLFENDFFLQPLTFPTNNINKYLLSKKFYIYDELDWLAPTANATIGKFSFREWVGLNETSRSFLKKEDSDLRFYLSARIHPLRVKDPKDADLFILPILTNYIVRSILYNDGVTNVCLNGICDEKLLHFCDGILANSKWFRKSSGSNHIVLLNSFFWDAWAKKRFINFRKCNGLLPEQGTTRIHKYIDKDRIGFNTFYVGNKCSLVHFNKKKYDVALIATMWSMVKKNGILTKRVKKEHLKNFEDRRKICNWTGNDVFQSKYSVSVCGNGAQCPFLAQSRVGFHPRGDTFSANRLIDTILTGTIPIFTLKEQYFSHQSFIDWNKLSIFIEMGESGVDQQSFIDQLSYILNDTIHLQRKTDIILENRDLFDWDTIIPFDTYMYMFQKNIWPETKVNNTIYSALIL